MRIAILGAGPAGLDLGYLIKRRAPSADVTVIEQNAPDATFGFGVVFSDRALEFLREDDEVSSGIWSAPLAMLRAHPVDHRLAGGRLLQLPDDGDRHLVGEVEIAQQLRLAVLAAKIVGLLGDRQRVEPAMQMRHGDAGGAGPVGGELVDLAGHREFAIAAVEILIAPAHRRSAPGRGGRCR